MASTARQRQDTLSNLISQSEQDFPEDKPLADQVAGIVGCSQQDLLEIFRRAHKMLKEAMEKRNAALDAAVAEVEAKVVKNIADAPWDTDGDVGTEEQRKSICWLVKQRWSVEKATSKVATAIPGSRK